MLGFTPGAALQPDESKTAGYFYLAHVAAPCQQKQLNWSRNLITRQIRQLKLRGLT